MSCHVLICDDSAMARKQLSKALPKDWDVTIDFAGNGAEALEKIQTGGVDVMFLDLNMPVKDGYETLEEIQRCDLPVIVIVVSGDIQPEAVQRTRALGAYDFIKKPVSLERLLEIQEQFGLFSLRGEWTEPVVYDVQATTPKGFDALREISNVAMGRAADLLAQLLNVFVQLPIPKVNQLEVSELQMALDLAARQETFSAVCQGLIGEGMRGEGLLIMYDSSYQDLAQLLGYQDKLNPTLESEMVMDIASILIGAFSKGLAEQLDVAFSSSHPVILGRHLDFSDLVRNNAHRWQRTLAIEITYIIEKQNIRCDLLLLFTEDSLPVLQKKVGYLVESV